MKQLETKEHIMKKVTIKATCILEIEAILDDAKLWAEQCPQTIIILEEGAEYAKSFVSDNEDEFYTISDVEDYILGENDALNTDEIVEDSDIYELIRDYQNSIIRVCDNQ